MDPLHCRKRYILAGFQECLLIEAPFPRTAFICIWPWGIVFFFLSPLGNKQIEVEMKWVKTDTETKGGTYCFWFSDGHSVLGVCTFILFSVCCTFYLKQTWIFFRRNLELYSSLGLSLWKVTPGSVLCIMKTWVVLQLDELTYILTLPGVYCWPWYLF